MSKRYLLLIIALALVVPLVGVSFFEVQSRQREAETFANLESVAKLKTDEVQNWLREREGDSESLKGSVNLILRVEQFLRQPNNAVDQRVLSSRLEILRSAYAYDSALLLDAQGRVLLGRGDSIDVPPAVNALLRKSIDTTRILRTDLYREANGHIHLDWLVPLLATEPARRQVIAFIVLRVDVSRSLYPMIRVWPTRSFSAETLLVRREGDSVLYLNELRHHKDSALALRLPIGRPDLPTAIAVQSDQPGTMRGRDYRDVDVLAAYRPVFGTDWRIVAKIDRTEVMASIWQPLQWIVLITAIGVLSILLAMRRLLTQQRQVYELKAHAAQAQLNQQLQSLGDNLPNGFVYQFEVPAEGKPKFSYISAGVEKVLGLTPSQVIADAGLLFAHIDPASMAEYQEEEARSARELCVYSGVLQFHLPHGRDLWLQVRSRPHRQENGAIAWDGIALDVTEQRQAQQEIVESEERFRKLFEETRQAITLVEDGHFVAANKATLAMMRVDRLDQFVGLSPTDISPESQPDGRLSSEKVVEVIETAFREGSNEFEWEHIRADGEHFIAQVLVTAIRQGKKDLLHVVWTDITQRKRAEAALRNAKAIIDSSDVAIISKTLDGTITSWNPGAEKVFGYAAAEVIGHPMRMLIPADRQDEEPKILMRIAQGKQVEHIETVRRHKDGREIDISASISPILDEHGKVTGASKIARDITAQKKAERELANYRHHLEAMVQERTAALSIAKEAAEAANRAKSAFLANMSHELRTPMNGIMGMAALAQRAATDAKLQNQLDKIIQASKHLLGVINDVLDISKIEAQRLTLERTQFRMGEVLENLLSMIGHRARDKGLQMRVDLPGEIARLALYGDPLRVGQILINFTGNAIKFTQQGSITIHARIEEDNPADVLLRFEVEDTGIGISAEDQKRLFTAFEQADSSLTRKYGGTGLGLAISKRLVEMMGGTVGLESTVGRGSSFWFTVRLSKAAEATAPGAMPAAPSAEARLQAEYAGTRILLAEDEPINQEVSSELLRYVGLTVDLAEDGRQAVDMARQGRYALILMDLQMPNLNGIDATREIRKLPDYARTPILAMTANAFTEDRQRCIEAGMNDHIAKPIEPERLYECLLTWLERSGPGTH